MSEVDEIIKDFEFLDSWEDKYQMIIDMGKSLPELDDMYMNDNYRLKGCQSTVYFVSNLRCLILCDFIIFIFFIWAYIKFF